jgi:GNAT superfamily N-acetyltransferase
MAAQFKLDLPHGLGMRPARAADAGFLEALHHSTRNDLRLIDGEPDFIESLVEMQHRAQTVGYGDQFPEAMYFIVEKLGESVGRVVVHFGRAEIRIVDLALIPAARGLGFGAGIIKSMQMAAAQVGAPLTLAVMRFRPKLRQLYASLGFQIAQASPMADLMVWFPPAMRAAG